MSHGIDKAQLLMICFPFDILTSESQTLMADETVLSTEMVATEEPTVEIGKSFYMTLINVGFDSRKKSKAGPRGIFFFRTLLIRLTYW